MKTLYVAMALTASFVSVEPVTAQDNMKKIDASKALAEERMEIIAKRLLDAKIKRLQAEKTLKETAKEIQEIDNQLLSARIERAKLEISLRRTSNSAGSQAKAEPKKAEEKVKKVITSSKDKTLALSASGYYLVGVHGFGKNLVADINMRDGSVRSVKLGEALPGLGKLVEANANEVEFQDSFGTKQVVTFKKFNPVTGEVVN